MAHPKHDCGARQRALDFCLGFFGITGLVLTAVFLLLPSLGARAILTGALLELAAIAIVFGRGYRYALWGMMCALAILTLVVGSACVPVSLNYDQRPDSPGAQIYARPQAVQTNRIAPQPAK